jgi:hypothetical protein
MQLEQFLAYGTYARANEMQACRIAQEDMTDISLVASYVSVLQQLRQCAALSRNHCD